MMGYFKQLWIDATPADLRDRAAAQRFVGYDRSEVEFTPDQVLAVAVASNGRRLPILSLTCPICGERAEVPSADDPNPSTSVSRINGDSRYGYETYHEGCC